MGPGGEESSGGWFEGRFVVDGVMSPTSEVRVQFRAEDAHGDDSVVEAAIDDFRIVALDPGCPAPSSYCTTSANSVGPGATMGWSGSQDSNDDSFTIAVGGAVPGQLGLFFYGPTQTRQALGEGTLCVDSSALFRLPAQKVDSLGSAFRTLYLDDLPPGGSLGNGDTASFSFWYRDPAGGGAGFNLADGLEVPFCTR